MRGNWRIVGIVGLFLVLGAFGSNAQEFSGYVKEMPSFYLFDKEVFWYNSVHNRLNFNANLFENFKINLGMRNRFLCGNLLKKSPQYGDILSVDNGVVDLSWNIFNQNSSVLNTSFDRAFLSYTIDKVEIKLGRQRVNWGIGLVWNPNDIFNAFSYIDFDYEERPGSDAVSVTWYNSATSSFDIVAKFDKNPIKNTYQSSLAARYLFNAKNYDFQFIGGKSKQDVVGGFGWSGAIKNVSFRGEMSLFVPVIEREINNQTAFVATMEADYSFPNSLYLHGAVLFNSLGKKQQGMNLLSMQNDLSAKNLSYGMFEIFGNISYPVSPILNLGLAAMLNPVDLSSYISPTATISLQNNLELSIVSQVLMGKNGSEYAALGNVYAGFARLKWSF